MAKVEWQVERSIVRDVEMWQAYEVEEEVIIDYIIKCHDDLPTNVSKSRNIKTLCTHTGKSLEYYLRQYADENPDDASEDYEQSTIDRFNDIQHISDVEVAGEEWEDVEYTDDEEEDDVAVEA